MSRAFADALGAPTHGDESATPLSVGVEHEYRVLRGGEQVPFDSLIATVHLGRRHLDPGDANSFRLESGAAVTCDDLEAELALPPVAVRPGFVREVLWRVARDEADLQERLRHVVELVGVSTHVSVSVDAAEDTVDAVARLYTQTFAPALMLLLDRRDSWGVHVRPRPGRLELCGEFARGQRLAAVVTFALGSVCACLAAVEGREPVTHLPPRLTLRVTPAVGRFGYTVWRTSGIGDLYGCGRAARLPLAAGGTTLGQTQLEAAWRSAHDALPALSTEDLAPLEAFVTRGFRLPVVSDPPRSTSDLVAPCGVAPSPFGRLVGPVQRDAFDLAPVMLTWPVVVLVAAALPDRRRAFVCLPRPALDAFLDRLGTGALDAILRAYLGGRPGGRRLEHPDQTTVPGLFDELGRRRDLLPAEPAGRDGRLDAP